MMHQFTIYDRASGRITRIISLPPSHPIEKQLREAEGYVTGHYHPREHCIDTVTGAVVPVSDDERARIAAQDADRAARARIDELERKQLRPMRELAADPNNAEAKRRLAEIDAEIAALRLAVAHGASGLS